MQAVNQQTVSPIFDKSVGTLLIEWKQKAPGFDAVRLFLASFILLFHSFAVCYEDNHHKFQKALQLPFVHPFLKMILPMFFFLSGFLVCGSAYRLRSTPIFLLHRILRILPALLVEVFLSAIFLGPLLSQFTLKEYFNDPLFSQYFYNLIGSVQFFLPGVFMNHPNSIVNVNLWTLRAEFYSYAFLSALLVTGLLFDRRQFLITFLLGNLIFLGLLVTVLTWGDAGVVFVRPPLLVYAFFLGVFSFIFSDQIQIKKNLFFLSILGLFFFNWKYTTLLGLLSACYLCLSFGFMDLRKFPLIDRGDYSYGIYLYGYPIQQTLWEVFPFARIGVILFFLALPLTLIFSILSWTWIEKPFLKLKKFLPNQQTQTAQSKRTPF
ncbi:MAG: acyltransferase family protein [Bdellovibrionia bacterium]